jgi:transcriptional regulator of acetoin/glycerol metabolism/DNA-binding CsgD family transcriptional regulator
MPLPPAGVRDSLAALVTADAVPEETAATVPAHIDASWRRCVDAGLVPDTFRVPQEEYDADGPLAQAATEVVGELSADVGSAGIGVLLANDRGQVIDRRAAERRVRASLDRIDLAPGSVYAEAEIGTNAIGTALAEERPSFVEGHEHFADALTAMTCAAWPILDRDGQVIGAIDLSCAAPDGSPLMMGLVRRAASDIEQNLVSQASRRDASLERLFALERRRVKGPLAFVSEKSLLLNGAARRLVTPQDQEILWQQALDLLRGSPIHGAIELNGHTASILHCHPVHDGGELIGASIRLAEPSSTPIAVGGRGACPTLGWGSLTESELTVIDAVCDGLTNRQAAERLMMSPYTVDSHLRSIYRKLDVNSRVGLVLVAREFAALTTLDGAAGQ